jgi:hypothetical protein
MSSTDISKPLRTLNPGALDSWWGPYQNVAAACAAIPNETKDVDGQMVNFREGKKVGIITSSGIVEHWWGSLYTDIGLIPFVDYTNITAVGKVLGLSVFLKDQVINTQLPFTGYVNNTGVVSNATNWKASDFIEIPVKQLQYNGKIYGTLARFAFYDINKALISTITPGAANTGAAGDFTFQHNFTPPANTRYIRYCSYVIDASLQNLKYNDVDFYNSDKLKEIDKNTADLISVFSSLLLKARQSDVVNIQTLLGVATYINGDVINTSMPFSGYLNSIGTVSSASDWKSSFFIEIPQGKVLQYNGRIYGNAAYFAFFDANKNLLSVIQPGLPYTGAGGDNLDQLNFTPPAGTVYLRYCSYFLPTTLAQNLKYADPTYFISSSKVNQLNQNTSNITSIFADLLNKANKSIVDGVVAALNLLSYSAGAVINTALPFNGYLNPSGVPSAATNWKTSDFLEIPPNKSLTFNGRIFGTLANFCFYDASKVLIPSQNLVPGTAGDISVYNFTTPATNAKYIRYCSYVDSANQKLTYVDPVPYSYSQKLKDIDASVLALQSAVPAVVTPAEIIIPSKLLLVTGSDFVMYYENFITDVKDYEVFIDCAIGVGSARFWKVNPTAAGTFSMVIRLYEGSQIILEKTISIVVKAAVPLSTLFYLNFVGDSIRELGMDLAAMLAKFAALGGTQPIPKGTRTAGKTEARSGWEAKDFGTVGLIFYKFYFTGYVGTIGQFTVYSHNGSTYKVYEINMTSGTGYINAVRTGSTAPSASGVLVPSAGGNNINFSSYEVGDANPFWDGSAVNITNYRVNKLGMAAGDKFKLTDFQLLINDLGQFPTSVLTDAEIVTKVGYLKTLVSAYIADNPTGKIIVNLSPMCNNTGGGFPKRSQWIYFQVNMFKAWKEIIKQFDNAAFNANVVVGTSGLCIDRYEGYPISTVTASPRYAISDKTNSNSVHPRNEGYQEIGDNIFHQTLHLLL